MRSAFISNAEFIVASGVGRHDFRRLSRTLVTFTAFVLSGLMHSLSSSNTWTCSGLRPLWFYLSIAAAILVEEAFQFGCSFCSPHHGQDMHQQRRGLCRAVSKDSITDVPELLNLSRPSWPQRLLGYCWVASVHCWALPNLIIPQTYCLWNDHHMAEVAQQT
jgi:hypothetical protein